MSASRLSLAFRFLKAEWLLLLSSEYLFLLMYLMWSIFELKDGRLVPLIQNPLLLMLELLLDYDSSELNELFFQILGWGCSSTRPLLFGFSFGFWLL